VLRARPTNVMERMARRRLVATNRRLAILSMTFVGLALSTILSDELGIIMECPQVIGVFIHLDDDLATIASVTTIRTTPGDKFFPSKTDDAISTIPRFTADTDVVDE